jgi:hypothetical protein
MPGAVGFVAGSLWILGLALALAALSYADWLGKAQGWSVGTSLGRPGLQRTLGIACALFCAGLAVGGRAWWESVLWAGLALTSGSLLLRAGTRKS